MLTTTPFASRILRAAAATLSILAWAPTTAKAEAPCDGWDLFATPNVGNSVTRLTDVAAHAPDDGWAVGYWRHEPTGAGPLVLRWDGAQWHQADLPTTGHLGTNPQTVGVETASNGDVWVVGNVTTTYPTNNLPLVLRWRDGAWDHVETVTLRPQTEYPYAARGGFLDEVAALAPDDIWAVGIANGFGDAQSSSVPLAVHWDGSTWTDVEVPLVANRHHHFYGVVAIASDDVWAVGDYRNIAGAFRGVTYHWDGTAWSHVPSPIEAFPQSRLSDVVALGPDDVWAIGGSDAGPAVMHWNGSQWDLVPPPPNSGDAIAAVGADDVWVSGWNGFFHWDGATWTAVAAEVPGATYVIRSGGMEVVGDCDIWSVGFWTEPDGITSYTLAERLQPLPTAVGDGPVPVELARLSCHPNPFNPRTTLSFTLPASGQVQVAIYDAKGQFVAQLVDETLGVGAHNVDWDGRDAHGTSAPSGTYFCRLTTPWGLETRKMGLVR